MTATFTTAPLVQMLTDATRYQAQRFQYHLLHGLGLEIRPFGVVIVLKPIPTLHLRGLEWESTDLDLRLRGKPEGFSNYFEVAHPIARLRGIQ